MNSPQPTSSVVTGSLWLLALSPLWSLLLFSGLAMLADLGIPGDADTSHTGRLVLLSGTSWALACGFSFIHWRRSRSFPARLARTAGAACVLSVVGGIVLGAHVGRVSQPAEDLFVGAILFAPALTITWSLIWLTLRRVNQPGLGAAVCFGVAAFTQLAQLRFRAAPEVIQILVVPSLVVVVAFFVWLIAFLSISGPDEPSTAR